MPSPAPLYPDSRRNAVLEPRPFSHHIRGTNPVQSDQGWLSLLAGESIFDYEYLREFEAKIEKAPTLF
jgi:hypothetical protein